MNDNITPALTVHVMHKIVNRLSCWNLLVMHVLTASCWVHFQDSNLPTLNMVVGWWWFSCRGHMATSVMLVGPNWAQLSDGVGMCDARAHGALEAMGDRCVCQWQCLIGISLG